jgi:hypothetical protein
MWIETSLEHFQSIFALKWLLDGEASLLSSSVRLEDSPTDEASSPCNYFAERFNLFKVEPL